MGRNVELEMPSGCGGHWSVPQDPLSGVKYDSSVVGSIPSTHQQRCRQGHPSLSILHFQVRPCWVVPYPGLSLCPASCPPPHVWIQGAATPTPCQESFLQENHLRAGKLSHCFPVSLPATGSERTFLTTGMPNEYLKLHTSLWHEAFTTSLQIVSKGPMPSWMIWWVRMRRKMNKEPRF